VQFGTPLSAPDKAVTWPDKVAKQRHKIFGAALHCDAGGRRHQQEALREKALRRCAVSALESKAQCLSALESQRLISALESQRLISLLDLTA
jgi:hypothetical protein